MDFEELEESVSQRCIQNICGKVEKSHEYPPLR